MNSKDRDAMTSPSHPYMKHEDFLKLCKANHIEASESLLELYERRGLIYPIFRVFRTKEYIATLFEATMGGKEINGLNEYSTKLFEFEHEQLGLWFVLSPESLENFLLSGHPLEQAHARKEPFIIRPSAATFKDWEVYRVEIEPKPSTFGIGKTASLALHFYAPWQMYFLEEANNRYNLTINMLSDHFPRKNDPVIDSYQNIWPLRLNEWHSHFMALWDFIPKRNALASIYSQKATNGYIEGEAYQELRKRQRDLAGTAFRSHERQHFKKSN